MKTLEHSQYEEFKQVLDRLLILSRYNRKSMIENGYYKEIPPYQFAKEFKTVEYEVPIYVINDNYEFITSDTYQRPEEFIDISARAVYVSGGQSTTDTTYTWNVDANEAIRANPTDEMITFSFDEKGFYTITLTSVDRNGMIKMQTVRANVYI